MRPDHVIQCRPTRSTLGRPAIVLLGALSALSGCAFLGGPVQVQPVAPVEDHWRTGEDLRLALRQAGYSLEYINRGFGGWEARPPETSDVRYDGYIVIREPMDSRATVDVVPYTYPSSMTLFMETGALLRVPEEVMHRVAAVRRSAVWRPVVHG